MSANRIKLGRIGKTVLFFQILVVGLIFRSHVDVEANPLKDSKPNIIVIMPDDIGYGDIASLGNPVVQTPNIDSLKRELVVHPISREPRCSRVGRFSWVGVMNS